jgi:hypothetical protein
MQAAPEAIPAASAPICRVWRLGHAFALGLHFPPPAKIHGQTSAMAESTAWRKRQPYIGSAVQKAALRTRALHVTP